MNEFRFLMFLALLSCASVVFSRELSAEREFRSTDEMRAWLQGKRGFGPFQSYEINLSGAHVFVGWADPYSGRSVDHVYAYQLDQAQNKWRLIDATAFEKGSPISHVYVDKDERILIYVDQKGRKFKRISLYP